MVKCYYLTRWLWSPLWLRVSLLGLVRPMLLELLLLAKTRLLSRLLMTLTPGLLLLVLWWRWLLLMMMLLPLSLIIAIAMVSILRWCLLTSSPWLCH